MLEHTRKELGLQDLKLGQLVMATLRLEKQEPSRQLRLMASIQDLRNLAEYDLTIEVNGKKASIVSQVHVDHARFLGQGFSGVMNHVGDTFSRAPFDALWLRLG